MRDNRQSLVEAILYADIFNFALSKKEIFLYATGKCTQQDIFSFLKSPPQFIHYKEGLLCLKDRKELISLRKEKEKISKAKLEKAKKIAKVLKIIPSVKFIGLSGAVAVGNADRDDDLDLFIITASNTLWTTRLLVTLFLQLLGKKRQKGVKESEDKVCLNMFMAKNSLSFNKNRQDLYTAHEIVQLVPLMDKENTYSFFIAQNKWIDRFLPNAFPKKNYNFQKKMTAYSQSGLEKIAKKAQLWYMKKNRTIEEVGDTLLAFHPVDHRRNTLHEFDMRKKKYAEI